MYSNIKYLVINLIKVVKPLQKTTKCLGDIKEDK